MNAYLLGKGGGQIRLKGLRRIVPSPRPGLPGSVSHSLWFLLSFFSLSPLLPQNLSFFILKSHMLITEHTSIPTLLRLLGPRLPACGTVVAFPHPGRVVPQSHERHMWAKGRIWLPGPKTRKTKLCAVIPLINLGFNYKLFRLSSFTSLSSPIRFREFQTQRETLN